MAVLLEGDFMTAEYDGRVIATAWQGQDAVDDGQRVLISHSRCC